MTKCCEKCFSNAGEYPKEFCANPNCECHSVKASEEWEKNELNMVSAILNRIEYMGGGKVGKYWASQQIVQHFRQTLNSELQKVREAVEKLKRFGPPSHMMSRDDVFPLIEGFNLATDKALEIINKEMTE